MREKKNIHAAHIFYLLLAIAAGTADRLSLSPTPKQTTLKQLCICTSVCELPKNRLAQNANNQQQFQLTDEIRITPTHKHTHTLIHMQNFDLMKKKDTK